MKFKCTEQNALSRFVEAMSFLRGCYENTLINDIENFDDLLEALDIAQDMEYLLAVLESNHISY